MIGYIIIAMVITLFTYPIFKKVFFLFSYCLSSFLIILYDHWICDTRLGKRIAQNKVINVICDWFRLDPEEEDNP